MACALVVSMIDLAYPIISRYAMRTLLPQSAYRTFFTIMLIVLAAYALRSVLYFIITYWGHTFGIRVEADIRAALFGHMQELGFEFFDRNRTGQLMSRMTTDLFEITELAHHGPEDLFISLVTIVGALTVMATIEWRLALVVAVMIPVFIAIIVSRRKAMREASRRVKKRPARSTPTSNLPSPASARPRHSPTSTSRKKNSTARTTFTRPPRRCSTGKWAFSWP